jgi:hypothetical protein
LDLDIITVFLSMKLRIFNFIINSIFFHRFNNDICTSGSIKLNLIIAPA